MYDVTITGDGGVLIDHATTHDMGAGYRSADAQRELAISYAETAIAQAKRDGYRGHLRAIVRGPVDMIVCAINEDVPLEGNDS